MTEYASAVLPADFHRETHRFFHGRRVIVTGGTGFIGSHVVEQLLRLGATPIIPTRQPAPRFLAAVRDRVELRRCDLADGLQAERAFEGASVVLSLAAQVAGIEYNAQHPATIFQTNLQVFFNTISAAKALRVDRFLCTSSACVYPRHCSLPTPESEGFKDEPEPTNSGYGWAKRMEEYLSAQYAKEFGLSVAIARPYNAYGPRDNFDPGSSHVIPALIRKAFESKDGRLEVWGDGTHSRSFLFVDDFARGLLEMAARYAEADPVNIGADEETTIRDLATLVAEQVSALRKTRIIPVFNPSGLTGQPRRRCDTTKAQSRLAFRARVPFREGLSRTIQWYSDREDHSVHPGA
jgi:GDP-L-fucose synthase